MLAADEVKNRRALTYPVMRQSHPRLRSYLDRFQPRLAGAENTWLFPGRNGRHKHVVVLSGTWAALAASAATRGSISLRTSNTSRASRGLGLATKAPRLGSRQTNRS